MGRAGIGGAAEDDQLAGAQVLADLVDGGGDEGDVWVARLAQGRRHADVDHVHLGELIEVARRGESLRLDQLRDGRRIDVADVGAALGEGTDLRAVDVEARHAEARVRELHGEREPDVAEADDADARLARIDAATQFFELAHAFDPSCLRPAQGLASDDSAAFARPQPKWSAK